MACKFCQVVSGEVDATIVHRGDAFAIFLDTRPLFKGHCLVVPAKHVETLGDLPKTRTGDLFRVVRVLSTAVERAMDAEGTFVALNNRVSQSVPHLHVHVVPRTQGDGLRGFFWPRTKYESDAERRHVAERIGREFERRLEEL